MKNINYIWTKKAEDDARTKGLEPRRAGTAAYLGYEPLQPGEVANAWTAKGYVTPLTIEQQIINHYMQFVTDVETIVDDRRILYRVGDRFAVEVTRCDHDLNNPHDNMRVWRKAGFIKTMLPTHIAVDTYYYDINGNCWGLYNITEKLSDDGNRRVINFDYLREWTQDNINELVAECIRMCEMDITHQGEAVTAC